MNKIEKLLKDNIEVVRKIEKLMSKVEISNNKKEILLAGFTRNALSHFISINILMEKKLYNSAFSLIRIYFENILKLSYMYRIMDDTKITTIYDANSWDNHFPQIGEMATALDDIYNIEFYTEIKENAYKMMNDYTHTGKNQIARNFNDVAVDSSFSDELILDTIEGCKVLLKISMTALIESCGFKKKLISKDEMDEYLTY